MQKNHNKNSQIYVNDQVACPFYGQKRTKLEFSYGEQHSVS